MSARPSLKFRAPRDSQRSRVYTAERVLLEGAVRFESLEACAAFVKRCVGSAKFRRRWPEISSVEVAPKHHGPATGSRLRRRIRLPRWAWSDAVVLHELAHVCADDRGEAAHGRAYARTLLELVRLFIGPGTAKALRRSYREHGVRWTKRPKLSEAARARMAARFRERFRGSAACPGGSDAPA